LQIISAWDGVVFWWCIDWNNRAYRTLFVIDAISFVVFFAVIYLAIAETYRPPETKSTSLELGSSTA